MPNFEYTVSDGKVTITKYKDADTEVVIPSEIGGKPVTSVGDYAFYDCLSLKEVKVPKRAIIGDEALGFKHKDECYWNSCPEEDFTVTYQ